MRLILFLRLPVTSFLIYVDSEQSRFIKLHATEEHHSRWRREWNAREKKHSQDIQSIIKFQYNTNLCKFSFCNVSLITVIMEQWQYREEKEKKTTRLKAIVKLKCKINNIYWNWKQHVTDKQLRERHRRLYILNFWFYFSYYRFFDCWSKYNGNSFRDMHM